jgi:hypothetical protein
MRAAFKKYSPNADYQVSGVTDTWSAFELFRKAMANAPDNPTSQDVMDAMYALKSEDVSGLLPFKLTYTPNQPAPQVPCFYLYQYSQKKGIQTWPTSYPSGNSVSSGGLKSTCYPPK